MNAEDLIEFLALRPLPEGGHYAEVWREPAADGRRGACTAIYFLLRDGETSHWHRVDATEIWHWYAGAPLRLGLWRDGEAVLRHVLGNDFAAGQRPQAVVPAHVWQSARSLGAWTLVGCTVSPAFEFAGFELAPKDWRPG